MISLVMFISVYNQPRLFNAHVLITLVHVFMKGNKLCLNPRNDFGGRWLGRNIDAFINSILQW